MHRRWQVLIATSVAVFMALWMWPTGSAGAGCSRSEEIPQAELA